MGSTYFILLVHIYKIFLFVELPFNIIDSTYIKSILKPEPAVAWDIRMKLPFYINILIITSSNC